jgi:hypothetical protein
VERGDTQPRVPPGGMCGQVRHTAEGAAVGISVLCYPVFGLDLLPTTNVCAHETYLFISS